MTATLVTYHAKVKRVKIAISFSRESIAVEGVATLLQQVFMNIFLNAIDLDGLDLARQIRELDASLPIIIVSGYFYAEDAMIQGAKESGQVSAFVSKPFEHQEILRVIELHATQ